MSDKYFKIDEVAKITGLTKRTIRYYEDMELIKTNRTEAGYRLYSEDDINKIKEIKDLRLKLGLNICEIKKLIGLRDDLDSIYQCEKVDINAINDAIAKVKLLYNLTVEKEEIMLRVKNNCADHINKLSNILSESENKK